MFYSALMALKLGVWDVHDRNWACSKYEAKPFGIEGAPDKTSRSKVADRLI